MWAYTKESFLPQPVERQRNQADSKSADFQAPRGRGNHFPPHRYHAMWDYSWDPGATYSLSMSAWEWRRPWFLRARMLKCTRVNTCILHQLFASEYISSTSNCFSDTFIMKMLERYGPTGTRMFTGAVSSPVPPVRVNRSLNMREINWKLSAAVRMTARSLRKGAACDGDIF